LKDKLKHRQDILQCNRHVAYYSAITNNIRVFAIVVRSGQSLMHLNCKQT